ncbi:SspB family protein [Methylobacterium platani]|uniref:Stringent starvation protein B n=2 Tax=Methylobacterium platani TaxID=427683 RepID=A0A179SAL8_9HYPH|nr:ClpXP protease specificity-enhancing factor SspB [Methylobacterium platani]KMO17424.1 Stringent starvation protein B [Methylobacterium platani JCM 14648]OAS24501.1 Stringent starvation protein B [Methylobacterium platani]
MADDLIRYDLLVQDALRNVVRKVLGDAARDGLAGEHHFYVSFRTDYPGVRISQRLREKYPQDMTIVLQHQFWDLGVTEHTFEVGLSFSGVPERLLVPFEAVTGFFDPSVQFGLKFELNDGSASTEEAAPAGTTPLRAIRGAGSEPSEALPKVPAIGGTLPKIVPAAKAESKPQAKDAAKDASGKDEADGDAKPDEAAERTDAPQEGASVVSLDAFRKKS